MKLKEFIKTIILTGLVICSLVLSAKIWFSKELWPDGYNSFHSARKSNVFSGIFSVMGCAFTTGVSTGFAAPRL